MEGPSTSGTNLIEPKEEVLDAVKQEIDDSYYSIVPSEMVEVVQSSAEDVKGPFVKLQVIDISHEGIKKLNESTITESKSSRKERHSRLLLESDEDMIDEDDDWVAETEDPAPIIKVTRNKKGAKSVLEKKKKLSARSFIYTEKGEDGKKDITKCKICHTPLHKRSVYRHVLLHDNLKETYNTEVFTCKRCDTSVASLNLFMKHICPKRSGPAKEKCNICSKYFTSKPLLNTHMLFHFKGGTKPLNKKAKKRQLQASASNGADPRKKRGKPCTFCDKQFASSWQLNRHVKVHMKPLKKATEPKCQLCGKIFANNYTLKIHSYLHLPEMKAFRCEICKDKYYATKAMLERHMKYHSDEKSLKCTFCERMFKVAEDRSKHEKLVHLKTGTCQCAICYKWFVVAKTLRQHLRTHTNELLRCKLCPKEFSSQAGLQYHMKWHTNDKSFKCPDCGKAFYTSSKLNRHRTSHSKNKELIAGIAQVKSDVINGEGEPHDEEATHQATTSEP